MRYASNRSFFVSESESKRYCLVHTLAKFTMSDFRNEHELSTLSTAYSNSVLWTLNCVSRWAYINVNILFNRRTRDSFDAREIGH